MSDVIYNISSGFYDSVNGDRLYSAADMNKPYKRVIADGIFPTPQGTPSTDFQVVAVSGMSVAVLAGNAMIGARWAENTDDVGITIAGNSSSSPRIDSIFLHIDTGMDTRAAGVVYRQGTAAGTPTAPAMVQTDNITELRLADILVAPSAAIITQANITDQRGGSDCPWVAGLIQQVDTSALFDQYRAAYAEQQQDQADEWNTFMDHLARDYDISMSLRKHESTYTSTAAASLIPINIDGYDTTKDLLQVYINGIFAVEGTHYIVKSAAQIQLTNAISAGQNVHFVIYKAVMGGAQPIIPTDDQVQDAVDAYMDAHPGALVVDPELSDTSTHAIQNKAVTEALAGVNGRLDSVTISRAGANINTVGYEGGYITSAGADTSAASYETVAFRSNGYIPVSGGKTLYWWGKLSDGVALGANAVIVEYDESKNLIGARHQFNKYGTTASDQAFTTSPNAAYVRIALYQGVEDKSTIQIALYYDGDEQAAYIPPQDISVLNYDKIYNGAGQSVGQIIDNKISDLGVTPLYDYEEITVTGESGALMPDGTVRDTTDVTRYKIPVLKGEKYVVSARHGYAYRAFLVLDDSDNILSYYPAGTSGTAIHRNVSVDIEENGFLVLQDVYHFMPVLGKVSKYTSNDKLYMKSIYWNGDSVCFGAGGKSFADQISLAHAMPETMDAVSGTRLSTRSGSTNSIYERVVAMDTSADYDYIGIEGGYNDYFSSVPIGTLMANYTDTPDTTTVIGAVEGICKHIRTNFSSSKFFFVLGHRPIGVGQYPTDVDTYWDAIISALEKWAVPYVDIRKEGTLMAYNSDWLSAYFGSGETMGTHPNALGYKLFYNSLVETKMQSLKA